MGVVAVMEMEVMVVEVSMVGRGGGGSGGTTINKAELFVTPWKTYDDKKCQLGTYQNN